MTETDEVGCQINLATGRHFGECKGTCTDPDEHHKLFAADFSDTTHDAKWIVDPATGAEFEIGTLLARIEALEAQVRELQERKFYTYGLTNEPDDAADNE